jgi:hypothetical protein
MKYIIMEVTDETFPESILYDEESVRSYFYTTELAFRNAPEVE